MLYISYIIVFIATVQSSIIPREHEPFVETATEDKIPMEEAVDLMKEQSWTSVENLIATMDEDLTRESREVYPKSNHHHGHGHWHFGQRRKMANKPMKEDAGLMDDEPLADTTTEDKIPMGEVIGLLNDEPLADTTTEDKIPMDEAVGLVNDEPLADTTTEEKIPMDEAVGLVDDEPLADTITEDKIPMDEAVVLVNEESRVSVENLIDTMNKDYTSKSRNVHPEPHLPHGIDVDGHFGQQREIDEEMCLLPGRSCGDYEDGICRVATCEYGENAIYENEFCNGTDCNCCVPAVQEMCLSPGRSCGDYDDGICRDATCEYGENEIYEDEFCNGTDCHCCVPAVQGRSTIAPPVTSPAANTPPATGPTATAPPAAVPQATTPPATAQPATGPLATAPPATVPPATAPPATAPPVTAPPATATPATAPPATAPPATAPPATAPPSTVHPVTAPPDTTLPATVTPATAPLATAPSATSPPATAPLAISPPATATPAASPPATAPPATTIIPPATAPSVTAPAATVRPANTIAPLATAPPVTAPPATTQPVTGSPATVPPATVLRATAPPATSPPVTAPPATAPPATVTKANAPPTTAPPGTAPTGTAPPATSPTATSQPATVLPAMAPPATAPPDTVPPYTTPPAIASPATAPPATVLPAMAPPATAPPATVPQAIAPPATAPPATVTPAISRPPATSPSATTSTATAPPAKIPLSTTSPATTPLATGPPATPPPATYLPVTAAPATEVPSQYQPATVLLATSAPSAYSPAAIALATASPFAHPLATSSPTTAAQSAYPPATVASYKYPPATVPTTTLAPSTFPPSTIRPGTASQATAASSAYPPATEPKNKAAPNADPPATAPSATAVLSAYPPATSSPATDPPATAGASSYQPATASQATAASSTAAPSTYPSATASPSTAPPSSYLSATAPPATAPPATAPPATAPTSIVPPAPAPPSTYPSATPPVYGSLVPTKLNKVPSTTTTAIIPRTEPFWGDILTPISLTKVPVPITSKTPENFLVTLETGYGKDAGTISGMKMILVDQNCNEIRHNIIRLPKQDETQCHRVSIPKKFGKLVTLNIALDNMNGSSSDWFCENIFVDDSRSNNRLYFPIDRWIQSTLWYKFQNYATSLPQFEPDPRGRELTIQNKRMQYEFTYHLTAAILDHLPDEEFIYPEYLAMLINLSSSYQRAQLPLIEAYQSSNNISAFYGGDFYIPESIQFWREDAWFGAQRIQGIVPNIIELCRKIPEKLGVTEACVSGLLEGLTLQQALENNKIFVTDLGILDGIQYKTNIDHSSPIAVFYLNKRKELLPIAIQLKQKKGPNNPIYTPKDPPNTWLVAKIYYNNAEAQFHTVVAHYGYIHFIMDGIATSMNRQLSPSHPIFKILKPHFLYLLAINKFGIAGLMIPNGVFDRFSLGLNGTKDLLAKAIPEFTFRRAIGSVESDARARGVWDKEVLPYYPFRNDAHSMYNIIKKYVTIIMTHYYDTPGKIADDWELQNWRAELARPRTHGGVGIPDLPGSNTAGFTHIDEIIDLVTMIITHNSIGHAAVNFAQYDTYGYFQNYPADIIEGPPLQKQTYTEDEIMRLFPDLRHQATIRASAMHGTNDLGDFERTYLYDPVSQKAQVELTKDLNEFSKEVKKRNRNRFIPYKYLDPNFVPNASSI